MRQLDRKTAIVTGAGPGVMEQKEWPRTRHQRIIDAHDDCERRLAERSEMATGHAG
jgi:hypothetical protein